MAPSPQTVALEAPASEKKAEAVASRGSAHARRSVSAAAVHAEWKTLEGLGAIVPAWERLAQSALEPNIFYEPAFALPAGEAFGAGAGAVLVWNGAHRERLIGLFPARVARRRYGFGPSILLGWTHPYAPLGTPLVDGARAAEAIVGWLDFLGSRRDMPRLALLACLTADGPVASLIRRELARRGGKSAGYGAHSRALFHPATEVRDYLVHAIGAKKRKELRRQRRRLGADLTLSRACEPSEVEPALATFLRIECEGWKGRNGTAASQDAGAQRFMREAVLSLAARGQAEVMKLSAGERTLAAGIVLRSGARAWFWKVAYDESAARNSPGVQLTLDLTAALLGEPDVESADSCAMPEHPMIDRIWRERLAIADMLIAPDARAGRAFAFAHGLEAARRGIIGAAKRLRGRLRPAQR
jgi:CelD/BcsL family acetyltransferase involved in cellulose biosynthesis